MGGGGVTKKLVKCKGSITFLNTLRMGRARIFYITVDGDSSGPPPLLKMNAPLVFTNFFFYIVISTADKKLLENCF